MKTFRYNKGHPAGSTMTVKELKELLSKHPDDMPVMATWEGVTAFIDDFSVVSVSKGMEEDREDCLMFDVECY